MNTSTNRQPVASIVIPVLDGAEVIGDQLAAILAQDFDKAYEIVVADNGSTDDTRTIVRSVQETDERVRLVDASHRPKGGAGAKNCGVEHARSGIILFTDADDVVAPGWLREGYDALLRHTVVAFRCDHAYMNGSTGETEATIAHSGLDNFLGVPTIRGGVFGIHRRLYLELGGFSEDLVGAVDTEFGVRLYKQTARAPYEATGAVVRVRAPSINRILARQSKIASSYAYIASIHRDALIVPPRSIVTNLKGWTWIIAHVPMTVDSVKRRKWLGALGSRLGRLQGLIKYGILLP